MGRLRKRYAPQWNRDVYQEHTQINPDDAPLGRSKYIVEQALYYVLNAFRFDSERVRIGFIFGSEPVLTRLRMFGSVYRFTNLESYKRNDHGNLGFYV